MNMYAEQPHMQLAVLSRGYVVSRALHTIARLGIANHMSSTPVDIDTLAEKTGTRADMLDRLLRFLSSYEVFKYEDGAYTLTSLSRPLRDDDPHSIRDVLCMVDENWWQAFSRLDLSLKTGESGFFHQHGDDFFTFLSKSPEKQDNFDKGMARLSTYDDEAISKAYPFNEFSTLVDMGGGRGGLSKAIQQHFPELEISILDTPAVINQLTETDFPKKIHLISGDFFADIPLADAYIFKGVLHDFNDENMQKILKNCAQKMPNKSILFIAEQVMPDDEKPHPNKTMDIVMMALLGGRQRRLSEWKSGIEPAGFVFKNSYQTESIFTLMKFQKREI